MPERTSQEIGSMGSFVGNSEGEPTILLKNDLEKFVYEELDITNCLI